MGRKYASLHVYANDLTEIFNILKDSYNGSKEDIKIKSIIDGLLNENPNFAFLNNFLNKVIILKTNAFISIYDENNSFENIKIKAKYLSSIIEVPIIYTSNFDDDLFLIGVYKAGKLVASGVIGDDVETYELKPKNINIDKFCSAIGLQRTSTFELADDIGDIDKIEDEVEKFLQIPLDFNIDSLLENNMFEKWYSDSIFSVYTKKS